ncbi:uncharacterized protein FOMMEDRAFT_148841 [Fomitiporia mediterranea MF3/22]|uniref:uncharacterized protein n=1 Tax=Fomitiporia mediterranea (strain MF3/22) TaxID=694068 RepID=UPI0004408258|nr:uncharacterized protein FOMMEDRAFT_148841 [Fomitiporia mediterranea MF3/22]EJC99360.1 hypothetical protein FOMMEDRAFT_148841 [Fomitiporia mediterranea MF3/22]
MPPRVILSSNASPSRAMRPRTQTVDGLPYSQQRYDPLTGGSMPGTPRDVPHPGSPRVLAQPPKLPPLSVAVGDGMAAASHALDNVPWLEKPKVEDPSLRRTLDDVERSIGILIDQQKQGQGNIGLGLGDTSRDKHPVITEDDSYAKIEKTEVGPEVILEGQGKAGVKRARTRRATSQLRSSHNQAANRRHTYTISEPANHAAHLSAPSMAVGEVRGWFANLFNWKAQQYVLHSVDNCLATRDEATRVLQALGCQVVLEEAQGWGVLKCKMDEKYDKSTGLVTMKSVRFRAEFSPVMGHANTSGALQPPQPSGNANVGSELVDSNGPSGAQKRTSAKNVTPFASTLVLVQEKGALSTFKHVHSRLQSEWRGREPLRSPELNGTATPMVGVTPRLR